MQRRTTLLALCVGFSLTERSTSLSLSLPTAALRIFQVSVLIPPGQCDWSVSRFKMLLAPSFVPSIHTKTHGAQKKSKSVSDRKYVQDPPTSQQSRRGLVTTNAQLGLESLAADVKTWCLNAGTVPSILTAVTAIVLMSWVIKRGLGFLLFLKDWFTILLQLSVIQLQYVTKSLSVQKEVFFLLTLDMARRMQELQDSRSEKQPAKDGKRSLIGVLPHVDTLMWRRSASSPSSQMQGGSPLLKELVLVGGGHAHAYVLKNLGMNPIPSVGPPLLCHLKCA
jgi:hypothetical protein